MDRFATVADGEDAILVALSLALGAAQEEVAQELHLHLLVAESGTAVAASLTGVEREGRGAHPRGDRLILHAEEFPDSIEDTEVDCGCGAWGL